MTPANSGNSSPAMVSTATATAIVIADMIGVGVFTSLGFQVKDITSGFALLLLWIVAPPGLEAFFREVATRPGVPPVQRTKEQLNEIARKYATEFR